MSRPIRMRLVSDARAASDARALNGVRARNETRRDGTAPTATVPDAPTVRGVAKPPDSSITAAPLVGPVFRPIEPHHSRPARDWALFALLVGYPLWRLLGANLFIVPLMAIPMALELYRRRSVKIPSGFSFYAALLLISVLSLVMINRTPPGAIAPVPGFGRYLAWAVRFVDFLAGAVVLLYVGNLTERELPTRRVVKMLAALFVSFVVGGLIGMVVPNVKILSPIGHILPHAIRSNAYVQTLITVQFAQYQSVIGAVASPRPDFPVNFTNSWGECIALLLPWFIVAVVGGRRSLGRNLVAGGVVLIALVPIIYSLNRGMWIGLGIGMVYLLYRLAVTGRGLQVAIVLVATAMAGIILLVTPLSTVVTGRVANPKSNDGRANINAAAVVAAGASPVIGYGGMSGVIGSARGITIGPTADCPTCGNLTIGGDGQMWQLLITTGFLGAGLYIAFFMRFAWKFRRDHSPYGIVGIITMLMMLWFMTVYSALDLPLIIAMVALGLWWRHARGRVDA